MPLTEDVLLERILLLEERVAKLERSRSLSSSAKSSATPQGAAINAAKLDLTGWTKPYEIAELEPAETWIELHEPSARPHLQRMIREVVSIEGPITERLALDRVRRAWGLRRAGGRVQQAFEQAVRQLAARTLIERDGDSLLLPGKKLDAVRVPSNVDESRRGADEVPLSELLLAMQMITTASSGDGVLQDELMALVAKLMGWTRRGGAITERLDAALALGVKQEVIVINEGLVKVRAGD